MVTSQYWYKIIDIKLQLAPSNFNLRNLIVVAPDVTVSITSAVLHVRKQQVMSSAALVIENLRVSRKNIKLVPHTVTNQRHFATGSWHYTNSSFINGEIPSKLASVFIKSASAIGLWINLPHKFEMFGLLSLINKANWISLYNISFDKSSWTLYELTMQSLDRDSQLFENSITDEMFTKNHGIIALNLSGT